MRTLNLLAATAFATALSVSSAFALTVGFSQIGSESGWRAAETSVTKLEAQKRGIDLKFADAQQKQENQIKAVRSFIAQGVDAILIAPVVATGWDAVLKEAKEWRGSENATVSYGYGFSATSLSDFAARDTASGARLTLGPSSYLYFSNLTVAQLASVSATFSSGPAPASAPEDPFDAASLVADDGTDSADADTPDASDAFLVDGSAEPDAGVVL